jgi:predicted anti-sigma-YlaC factor YlaD
MTCRETIRFICEYLDGTLTPSVASEVERHVTECKDCRLVLDAARKTLINEFDYVARPAA